MKPFNIIVAMDENRGIGKNKRLPWHLSGDLNHFKQLTYSTDSEQKQNVVLMGRKTWESIPEKFRPLPNRINIVITRQENLKFPNGVYAANSLKNALLLLDRPDLKYQVSDLFIIGGAQIYKPALQLENCSKLYVTHIKNTFDCDTFFPPYASKFDPVNISDKVEENGIVYYFAEYQRRSTQSPPS